MASQAIGSLYVALGLDSAAFTQGVKSVRSASDKLQDGLERVGTSAIAMGKRMSVVSGAMAAVGAAGIAMVQQMTVAADEIAIQSKIANASTREFQRWAAGAKTAGIQQDKLADILNYVNDRVGEFMETGGGPMADFFENVAPKVGVTAEQFKLLSGPQALQLYVDTLQKAGLNQQQMTFYLEAMASDATALIPLLQNGGAAMSAYGDAAEKSGAILSDSAIRGAQEFQDKLTTLRSAVDGVRNRLAEALLPAVNQFMDVLVAKAIPAMNSAVTAVQDLIQWFGDLPGPVQDAALAVATVLGTGGPILLAIGALSLAMKALVASAGPIGLFITAATLLAGAWIKWGDDIKAAVGTALDWVRAKFNEIVEYLKSLPEKFAEFGRMIIDGLVRGIKEKAQEAVAAIKSIGQEQEAMFQGIMDIHSPSKVFQQFGRWIVEGLGLGITQNASLATDAVASVADGVAASGEKAGGAFDSFASNAQSAFQSVITGAATVKDALKQLAVSWLSSFGSNAMSAGFDALFGGIGANANGTSNWRGGLTRINERGGEIVNLPSGSGIVPHDVSKRMADRAGRAGTVDVRVFTDESGNWQAAVEKISGNVAARAVGAYDKQMPTRVQQISARPRMR